MKHSIIDSAKRLYVILLLLLTYSVNIYSQAQTTKDLEQYLFSDFSASIIKMKADVDINLVLNYNTVTEKMVFLKDGQLYDMVNPETVDTVYLRDRVFIYYFDSFLEVLVDDKVAFFIQNKSDINFRTKPTATGTAQVSESNYHQISKTSEIFLNLKLPEGVIVKPASFYWVRVNNKMAGFKNTRQFLKIFPEESDQMKQFIKESNIQIGDRNDLIKLGNFCNKLLK